MPELTGADQELRGLLARMIADRGHAPPLPELAEAAGMTRPEAEASLRRLHDAHALLLHPHKCEPWAVHPFALSPGSCWVETGRLIEAAGVFHFAVPAGQWWDNVIHACACFQPFATEAEIGPWCERHALPRGHVMALDALWRFASDWYGGAWTSRGASGPRRKCGLCSTATA